MTGLHVLLVHREVVRRRQGVRRAAAQMPLIEDWEATVQRPQVHMFLGMDMERIDRTESQTEYVTYRVNRVCLMFSQSALLIVHKLSHN